MGMGICFAVKPYLADSKGKGGKCWKGIYAVLGATKALAAILKPLRSEGIEINRNIY